MGPSSNNNSGNNVISFVAVDRPPLDRTGTVDLLVRDLEAILHEVVETAEDDHQDESDRLVIADEQAFIARFGFDWPRRDRSALIRLKHELDITDREIRWLNRTGDLYCDVHGVKFSARAWVAIFGVILLFSLFLLMLVAWGSATSASLTFVRVLKLAGVMVPLFGMTWLTHRFYVWPWRIHRRVSARLRSV